MVHRDLSSNNIVMLNAGESIEEMEKNILKIIDVNDQDSQGFAFVYLFIKKFPFFNLIFKLKYSFEHVSRRPDNKEE